MLLPLIDVATLSGQTEYVLFSRMISGQFPEPFEGPNGDCRWERGLVRGWLREFYETHALGSGDSSQFSLSQVLEYTGMNELRLLREVRRRALPPPFHGPNGSCIWFEDAVILWHCEEMRSLYYERDPRAGG